MKRLFASIMFILALTTMSFSQNDNTYMETLKTMFEVSGAEGTYETAMTQMFSMFKQQYSGIDESIWSELEAEFNDDAMDDLVEILLPIYQEHLTIDDLKGVIAFYETPLGKKYALKTPIITQAAMQAGQSWGMKIGQDFAEKMKARGY